MEVQDVLTNEYVLVGVGLLLTALTTAGIAFARRRLGADREFVAALEALSSAVGDVHAEYVSNIKQGRADGRLTDLERAEARNRVYDRLRRVAAREGLDVMRVLAGRVPEYIDRFVQNGKRGSSVSAQAPSGSVVYVPSPDTSTFSLRKEKVEPKETD